ncbi:C-terminal binding protein [Actinophytocola oryzae]|uniref:D-3-phosphoglycerate dehydrogenase n=1 Tax=Actinophytocola oryzae TaxID=502181 RepID=A0A4R7W1K3_9PSEU|nr:C-terminal binding protein [Actinophytocola oryzae]TDV56440.1 D-3-phosphoglycerate dehydrogenase [Actinophytocola oryzae]
MTLAVVTDVAWGDVAVESALCAAAGIDVRLVGSHDERTLAAAVPDADAIMTCFAPVTRAVIEAAPNLRVVARLGVGLDNIDVAVATARGIPVTRVTDYCVDEVATHALAMALALWRRLPGYDAATRQGAWGILPALPVRRLAGSRVAVLGRGAIGREVGRRWQALGVTVTDSVAGADVVMVHLPLDPTTANSVDDRVFDAVRPGALVVNCGRGGLLDLDAALTALDDGRLAGLGLDVYPTEPIPPGHPLLARDDVILSPHVAFYSEGSLLELRERATRSVIDELTKVRDG